jgi:hypothetical protein
MVLLDESLCSTFSLFWVSFLVDFIGLRNQLRSGPGQDSEEVNET